MPMTRNEILDFLKVHREELRQVYGVRKIALFGSHARLAAREDSDIDIAVELFEEQKTLTNFFGLKRYLEEHLGRPVDLGIESAMKPIVKEAAQKDMLYV
jgi:predicted nucleotidyltransferase